MTTLKMQLIGRKRRKWNQFPGSEYEEAEERSGTLGEEEISLSKCIMTPPMLTKSVSRRKNMSASSRITIPSIFYLSLILFFIVDNNNLHKTFSSAQRFESALHPTSSAAATDTEDDNSKISYQDLSSSSSSSSSSYVFGPKREGIKRCGNVFGDQVKSEFGHIFASKYTDVPFIVQITLENEVGIIKSKCVGAILTDTWIITSADCGADAIIADNNLTFRVTHFDLDFDHWSSSSVHTKRGTQGEGDLLSADANQGVVPIRQTINVTDIHLTSISQSCSPMLLKLQTPISNMGRSLLIDGGETYEMNNVCLPPNVTIRNEWKGIASGWSSYGDSVIERYLRLTQVSVRNQHCLSPSTSDNIQRMKLNTKEGKTDNDDEDNIFCVSYLPQVHFYLLPGSPLLTIHRDAIILMGVACSNLTSKLINSSYVYSQTYARLSSYLDLMTLTIDTDGNANEELLVNEGSVSVLVSKLLIFIVISSTLLATEFF